MIYVDVAVDNKSKYTDGLFTYKSPVDIRPGDLVTVPFGSGDREKKAIVCGTPTKIDCPSDKLKTISEVVERGFLSEEAVKTAVWMKQRYGIKYHDAFRCFVPTGKAPKAGKEKEPYKGVSGKYVRPESLTPQQNLAVSEIVSAIKSGSQTSFLLHGVTASGKTEVYMESIEKAVSMGKTAIMLVPEISLTKQVIETFAGRFGKETIAVLHSKLTPRERYDEWRRIQRGNAKIVIGARMAVFAPLKDIGLIVMDEEQESSYKADMTPKYDTVDIALKRISYYKGVLLLGSATPSVVSYYRVSQGIYRLLTLNKRYNNTPLPKIEIADMRAELREGNTTIFSRALFTGIEDELSSGRQCILLQNRRGYSNFISCRECGSVIRCPECGISLTYHKSQESLICHYCGRRFPLPKVCPECGSSYIKNFGIGTEQVEEAVKRFFPAASCGRLDIDALKTRKDLDRILGDFSSGKTDILIGTQLVAKGLDFENVGLVGIIAADTGLNIPDYRSCERTFQLITQAAGRAGRREQRGRVIIQTYEPDNYALRAASFNDYGEFFREEIKLRKFVEYPPFTDMIMVNFTAEDEENAFRTAKRCKKYLENSRGKKEEASILGPKVSMSFRGKDSVRFYMMIKCPKGLRNKYIYYLEEFNKIIIKERAKCSMDIDINPYSAY